MKMQTLKSDLLLLLTAAIWGFAFVAQSVGMKYVGPFTFNGVRFALGSLSLVPLIFAFGRKGKLESDLGSGSKNVIIAGLTAGTVLFIAASLQQIGLMETTAGKAAFITGLYIVFVPIAGIFLKQSLTVKNWCGTAVALIGLYFLCISDRFTISRGDLFELMGAFFWAAHILLIGHFSTRVDVLKLACLQFATCSVLSLATAAVFENMAAAGLVQAAAPILYGGLCSVGVAYTLQIVGQKNAQPSHAAIIMSMETIFATFGGFLILNERLEPRGILGSALMFAGMLLSQGGSMAKKEQPESSIPPKRQEERDVI
ncbi:MAG: DMT family transporter [Clostridiales bacterium]|jgi:drug/metabolite transporter (DMT)-like permease|nr:DMT family transporter [Eubacteriales bacterium]MDH7567508.1 DMT family transporter [Clostridiales bacterium]